MNEKLIRYRFGSLNGQPIKEKVTWLKLANSIQETSDDRCRELQGEEGAYFLYKVENNFSEVSSIYQQYTDVEGNTLIPGSSDYWSYYILPLRAGIDLLTEQEYIQLGGN